MQIHILITLSARALLQEAGATTLDLDAAPGLLLNVLDIGTAMANNLRSEVKARNWLEINGDLLFGPFALYPHQHERLARMLNILLCQTHLAPLALALVDENVSRQRGWGVPAS